MIDEKIQRIEWIDYVKGITIILVVIGHCGVSQEVNRYILSFHMATFFIISGFLYEKKYNSYTTKEFAIKKASRLLIPYLVFSIVGLVMSIILNIIVGRETNIGYSMVSILTVININNINMTESVLWFLPCIYVVEIMFFKILKGKYFNGNKKKNIIAIFCIAFIVNKLIKIRIPFTLDIAMTGLLYYGLGYFMKDKIWRYIDYIENNSKILNVTLVLEIFILILANSINKGTVYMYINEYGNYIISIMSGIVGTMMLINIAIRIHKFKIIQFWGMSTLLVYVLHFKIIYFTNFIIRRVVNILGGGFIITNILAIINTIIALMILIPIINIINSKYSWSLGKSNYTSSRTGN